MEIDVLPHEYVANLSENKHMMLLYDDPEYAREIETIFIAKGLQKGECCIYVSHDGYSFETSALGQFGIDGKRCIRDGTLHIVNSEDFADRANSKSALEKLLCVPTAKVRMVGRWIPDVGTVKGIASELELEKDVHSHFDEFPGSILCTYKIDNICKTDHAGWTIKIMNNHHSVMLLTGERKGTVHEF
ncbi:MAG TPA: MEDS domain-containing protein [Candidatus Nitrosotalea sp.]|nr:MEDS domain-containing protein [Candidatus Nitrosotalea sp.]